MPELNLKERTTTPNGGLMKRIKKTLKLEPANTEERQPPPTIDYPVEGEGVREGSYAIRVSAPANSEVEISINNGEWQPCRASVGYWWFDWQPMEVCHCKLVARSRVGKGRWKKSEARSCHIVNSDRPINVGLTFD